MGDGTIRYAHYQLTPRRRLNARTGAVPRDGALLRWDSGSGLAGYADLHPWPEFGDPDLRAQLDSLRAGAEPLALARRSLELAKLDAFARERAVSLMDGLPAPVSHRLLIDGTASVPAEVARAIEQGFTRLKLKIAGDARAEGRAFLALASRSPATARFRLDFNAAFTRTEVDAFLEEAAAVLDRLDFLEDPCPWTHEAWGFLRMEWGIRLAADWERPAAGHPADVQVFKPAARAIPAAEPARVVLTSAMDHPVGQAHAAVQTARFQQSFPARAEVAGLLSHVAYEPNAYAEALSVSGPAFPTVAGTGVGWDELLAREDWRELP